MMTFVNVNDPGLLVLPTHRVVHSLKSFSFDDFKRASGELFEVEEVEAGMDSARATALLSEKGRTGTAFLVVTSSTRSCCTRRSRPDRNISKHYRRSNDRWTWCNCIDVCWKAS